MIHERYSNYGLLVTLVLVMLSLFTTIAWADDGSDVARHGVTRVVILGTQGGPLVRPERAQAAILLVINGEPYLVDAGAGVVRRVTQAGFNVDQVRNIFITHNHLDHNAGLPALMSEGWLLGGLNYAGITKDSPPVTIYGPQDTKAVFEGAMKFLSVSARISNNEGDIGSNTLPKPQSVFRLKTHDKDGVILEDENTSVTTVENTHFKFPEDTPAYKANDRSYSYRFDTSNGSVCITGDTGPSESMMDVFSGCDLMISEVINVDAVMNIIKANGVSKEALEGLRYHMVTQHLTPENIGKMAEKYNIGTVVLTHIVPTRIIDGKKLTGADFVPGVKKYFDGEVLLANDLMELDLTK